MGDRDVEQNSKITKITNKDHKTWHYMAYILAEGTLLFFEWICKK